MILRGHSPSVRLFEAAACGVPIISDWWPGLDSTLFEPETEIMIARSSADVLRILQTMPEGRRRSIAEAARVRVLSAHTGDHRAAELEAHVAARAQGDGMNLVIFGLSVSSSWGNGHAALWRGLIRALLAAGHRVTFFERDVPYYADTRDLTALPEGGEAGAVPRLGGGVAGDAARAGGRGCGDGDVVLPGRAGGDAACAGCEAAGACFYDLDTPVTLARLEAGERWTISGRTGWRGSTWC